MIEIQIGKESIQLDMEQDATFIDSFELEATNRSPVILGQTDRGTFAIKPDSIRLDITSLDKKSKGGGCFFCKTPDPETDELKEYISYDIDLKYIETGFDSDGVRRGILCICGDCYEYLCEEIGTSPEIAAGIL